MGSDQMNTIVLSSKEAFFFFYSGDKPVHLLCILQLTFLLVRYLFYTAGAFPQHSFNSFVKPSVQGNLAFIGLSLLAGL